MVINTNLRIWKYSPNKWLKLVTKFKYQKYCHRAIKFLLLNLVIVLFANSLKFRKCKICFNNYGFH